MLAECNYNASESEKGQRDDINKLVEKKKFNRNEYKKTEKSYFAALDFTYRAPNHRHETLDQYEHRNAQAELGWRCR